METLIIEGVDFEMLERQRQALNTVDPKAFEYIFGTESAHALDGLLNMLNAWSDSRDV